MFHRERESTSVSLLVAYLHTSLHHKGDPYHHFVHVSVCVCADVVDGDVDMDDVGEGDYNFTEYFQ